MSVNTKTQINWKEIIERSGQTGYNIYDLVPVKFDNIMNFINNEDVIEAEVIENDDTKDGFVEFEKKINELIKIRQEIREKYIVNEENIKITINNLIEVFNMMREKVFKKFGEVPLGGLQAISPITWSKYDDLITKGSLAPRANLSDLKMIAEKLGFMIMPWEYHNKGSFENESQEIKEAIKEFEKLEKYLDLYVISPINYWDIEAHVKAEDPNKYIFRSSKIKDVVNAVEIQLPVLRQFHQRITRVEKITEALVHDQKQMQNTIKTIQNTLDRVVTDIAQIWEEIAEMREDIKEAKKIAKDALATANSAYFQASAALATAESAQKMALRAIDPMLFAVPKGHDMEKETLCIVGPVWGPDFSWMVAAAENIKPIIGQRKLIKKLNPFLLH